MLLLCQGRADAILNYYIFADGGNLKIETRGNLKLASLISSKQAGFPCDGPPGGYLAPEMAWICSGPDTGAYNRYPVESPGPFTAGSGMIGMPTTTTGTRNWLYGASDYPAFGPYFYIIDPYIDGTPINSSATFFGKSLASVGLNLTPLGTNIGSWTFLGDSDPNNVINVFVGDPPNVPVPAPLPLIGAAGAYGWSRRLRRRIGSAGNR